ncbi:hypothetical protein E9993_13795 [Labilibacter sediminis]|nr:hypothetical protein E9993_13795 [Labilibacter sediminis]
MKIKNIYFLFILVLISGCSTKKNTWLSRNYHNLTAHYNVYFNGNESFKEGVRSVEEGNVDDYSHILPVFPESKAENAGVASGQMDRAIEKGTKLIKKHSIRKKPEKKSGDQSVRYQKFLSQNEFNKWVDNAYLLIGKAHFYKQEYYVAQQGFSFMFREFRPGPEWYEAEIWNARASIELNDYAKAKLLLDNYDIEGKAPDKLYGFFAATYADFYIRQGMYEEAIPFLKEAIDGAWSKYYYRRFNFILAQLYHKLKQYSNASEAYSAVIKSNPPYEMAFNAKVNRASVMFGEGGLAAVQKEIKKLLRDKRNIDYEDQIYYALAMAYKAEDQEENASENFLLSIQKSIDNNHQKGLSFYEMGLMHYDKPEYIEAYYNLDSAIINLNESFPELEQVQDLHASLNDLVYHINTVEREDSLQRIAALSENARMAFIDQLIEDEKKRAAELKRKEELMNGGDMFFDNSYSQRAGASQGGKWYFYNPNSVAMGKMEFEKRWGRRKLEDNWRRTNKEVVVESSDFDDPAGMFSETDGFPMDSLAQDSVDNVTIVKETNPLSRNFYLNDLPLTAEKIQASNSSIEESLLSMGLIYKDELINIPFAIEVFKELISRFPDGVYLEDALMNLYLCYQAQGDAEGMAQVKKQLLTQFPDGEFTAFLNDPDFFKKKEEERQRMEDLYQQSYSSYLFNEFNSPIANAKEAVQIDDDNELLPKFKFLAGLSYAKLGQLPDFEKELIDIRDNYGDSEVAPLAIEMLKLYEKGRVPVKGPVSSNLVTLRSNELKEEQIRDRSQAGESEEVATSYVVDNKAKHNLILLVNKEADLNRLKFNIADYNFSKFLMNDYEMSSSKLPDGTPIFSVGGFNNRLEALDYFYALRERDDIFSVDNLDTYKLFVIHDYNLDFLLSSGDKEGYDHFFSENYLSADAFKNQQEEIQEVEEKNTEPEQLPTVEENIAEPKVKDEQEIQPVVDTLKEVVEEKVEKEKIIAARTKGEETTEVVNKALQPDDTLLKEDLVPEVSKTEDSIKPSVEFVVEPGTHCAIILFKKGRINTMRTGTVFKNYTKSNYGTKFDVEFDALGSDYFYIKVDGFKDAMEAKAFLAKVKGNSFLMREISRTKHYLWEITNDNFHRLKDEKSFELYQQFYKINY